MFAVIAWLIVGYVLFQYPQPGVADQGDFDRVMNMSGLTLTARDTNDPNFVRFLSYTVTDYQILDINIFDIWHRLKATSMAYLITMISLMCKVFRQTIFKTEYLVLSYVVLYTMSIFLIIKYMAFGQKAKQIVLMLLAAAVLLDGNYLIWFNSLYGEPMMITTLLLYAAAWLLYIHHRYESSRTEKIFLPIVFIFVAAILFIGSKLQVIFTLPIILLMLFELILENSKNLKSFQTVILCVFIGIIIIYPLGINRVYKDISRDTQYNSVFFGILKDSDNPVRDLEEMGLKPDLAVDAGKHAFLSKDEYVAYAPHTPRTNSEFYSNISNSKLLIFYLTHPVRLYRGMEYTASQAFYTSTTLGKYPREYSETPIGNFSRFTWWSSWRENHLPRNLWFLLTTFVGAAVVSVIIYSKNRNDPAKRARIRLLWALLSIGLIQFPMPFVGNGHADTAKQLYLFNFIFDLLLVTAAYWCLSFLLVSCQSYFSSRQFMIFDLHRLNSPPDHW